MAPKPPRFPLILRRFRCHISVRYSVFCPSSVNQRARLFQTSVRYVLKKYMYISRNIVIIIRYLSWEATWRDDVCQERRDGAIFTYDRMTDKFTIRISHQNMALEICWQNESYGAVPIYEYGNKEGHRCPGRYGLLISDVFFYPSVCVHSQIEIVWYAAWYRSIILDT